MTVSLNEVEATAKKAARGAGYPWGLAEEAAKAVRWLCANDIDGCRVLAGLLTRFDDTDLAAHSPAPGEAEWRATTGMLCPLVTGAALSDRAFALTEREIILAAGAAPSLLIPFAAQAARQMRTPVTVAWPGGAAVTDGDLISVSGEVGEDAGNVTVRLGGSLDAPNRRSSRAAPDRQAWETLNRLAHRTYAPATEESRLLGAGAGLSDTD